VIVLDTSVLIDVLRGDAAATRFAAALEEVPACSEITRVEILRGLRTQQRSTERLLATMRWIGVDESIARAAGAFGRSFRASHRSLSTPDLIVAATAEVLGAGLATMNVRDFPMFKGLRAPY
jgi:predicted nucleic acid-binding protein